MNTAFYTSVSGMIAYQKNMDVLAHNMANVNTAGFKPQQASFSDILYTNMDVKGDTANRQMGHGVKVGQNDLIYKQGMFTMTENPLDFGIAGDGFFSVDYGDGVARYTRNGTFSLSVEGSSTYLINMDGGYVLDGTGKRIQVPTVEGGNTPDLSGVKDKIGVFTFPNPYGLQPTQSSNFLVTGKSGQPTWAGADKNNAPYQLLQGSLENSGVDVSQEMVNIIQSQKAFQFNAKVVQTADQIQEIINNLR